MEIPYHPEDENANPGEESLFRFHGYFRRRNGTGGFSPENLLYLPAAVTIRIVICNGGVRIEPATVCGFDCWNSPDPSGVPEIVAENDQSVVPFF